MKKVLSKNTTSVYIRGLEHLKRKDFAAAQDCFLEVVHQHPENSFAHHYLGETYIASSKMKSAEDSFRRAFEINPHFAPTILYLGHIAEKNGDSEKKGEFFESAIRQARGSSSELKQLAQTLARIDQGNRETVFDLYLEAHRSNPDDFECYLGIAEIDTPNADLFEKFGSFLANEDRIDESIFFLYLAAHLSPQNEEYWLKLSDVLSRSGDTASAEICQKRAKSIIELSVD